MSKQRKQPSMVNPMEGELAPPPERQYYSVAFICTMIQQPPDFVHRLMKTCDIEFAYCENGIGMIRGDDVAKMANMLADARQEIEGKCAAAPNN
jgi:hypothetical protein